MKILVTGDARVERVAIAARRSMGGASGWTTVEMQAEAAVTAPACWDDQARRLCQRLERLVEEQLEAQQVRRQSQRGNGGNGRQPVYRFWRAVYDAGPSGTGSRTVTTASFGRLRTGPGCAADGRQYYPGLDVFLRAVRGRGRTDVLRPGPHERH